MPATIRDVANRAGVSVATVSRLLNGTGRVGPDAAARVQAAIAALGFRPNGMGRSLKSRRSRLIGVMIPSLGNPVFADAVAGIEAEARAAGFTLLFGVSNYDAAEERRAVEALLAYRVDGMILTVAAPATSPALDSLDQAGLPHVLIYNQPAPTRAVPTVTVDNVAAGRAVALHMVALGHRRLGMITGALGGSDRAAARLAGFLDGARASGLARPCVHEVDFEAPDPDAALKAFASGPDGLPTALFCSNDWLAIATIGALTRQGLSVPGDVSVFGFDGIALGAHLNPPLATVVQPSRAMGGIAARHLIALMSADGDRPAPGSVPGHHLLPFTLRPAGSTGPVCFTRPSPIVAPVETTGNAAKQAPAASPVADLDLSTRTS